jgi:hypothetical protein
MSSKPDYFFQPGIKVKSNSKYEPLPMTDETVFDLARHYYTLVEIAERFKVKEDTVLTHHGEAFRAGKAEAMNKPRMLLNKIFDDFKDKDFADKDVPLHNLIKAIELHAKKHEGLGSKQTIEHVGKVQYDGVTSAPEIIEKP